MLYKIFFAGFLLILAFPLLNLPPFFSPPNWGKTISFRVITSILLFIFLWKLSGSIYKEKIKAFFVDWKKPEHTIFFILVAILFSFLLSTIFSIDPLFSLWGNPNRGGGFINFAFYVIFALLTFSILKPKSWKIAWNFSIFIGIIASIIAIIQWQGWLPEIFFSLGRRPISTMGNSIFLGIYILLLGFLALSFAINEKRMWKKSLYFLSSLLFLFIVIITESRAAYLGLIIGLSYFIFFYPFGQLWRLIVTKGVLIVLMLLAATTIYYVNTQEKLPVFVERNETIRGITTRLQLALIASEPRFSAWKVGIEAIKDRPIFGYGPENFSIAFDQHYDPSLPGIEKLPGALFTSWWDRAHNLFIDLGTTVGIPALIIYFSLFPVILWQLQRVKKKIKGSKDEIIAHGIQATLIGYLVASFFSFNTFSTYLIFFFLVGYSMHLLKNSRDENPQEDMRATILKWRKPIFATIFILLLWFTWQHNVKPFQINTRINIAIDQAKIGNCEESLKNMEQAKMKGDTFLNAYLNFHYVTRISECGKLGSPESVVEFAQKGYELLKEAIETRPTFTRNWIFLSQFANVLAEEASVAGLPDEAKQFLNKSESALEQAIKLSPKHQEIYIEWIKKELIAGNYEKAKDKAQECIDINSELGDCWWHKGLTEILLGDLESADISLKKARDRKYNPLDKDIGALSQLAKVYIITKNPQRLAEIYEKLIILEPENAQYLSSLATLYYQLGNYTKARKTALKVLELQPENRKAVEDFLRLLSN